MPFAGRSNRVAHTLRADRPRASLLRCDAVWPRRQAQSSRPRVLVGLSPVNSFRAVHRDGVGLRAADARSDGAGTLSSACIRSATGVYQAGDLRRARAFHARAIRTFPTCATMKLNCAPRLTPLTRMLYRAARARGASRLVGELRRLIHRIGCIESLKWLAMSDSRPGFLFAAVVALACATAHSDPAPFDLTGPDL